MFSAGVGVGSRSRFFLIAGVGVGSRSRVFKNAGVGVGSRSRFFKTAGVGVGSRSRFFKTAGVGVRSRSRNPKKSSDSTTLIIMLLETFSFEKIQLKYNYLCLLSNILLRLQSKFLMQRRLFLSAIYIIPYVV